MGSSGVVRHDRVGNIPIRIHAPRHARGAVIFFHGLRAAANVHEREAHALAEAGLTAILPDAPHHGARRTGLIERLPNALSVDGHRVVLRVVREARDEVSTLTDYALALGRGKVALAGISMGAYIALAGATIEPRAAAIVSIFGSPDWTPRDGTIPDDLAAIVAESPSRNPEAFPPRPLLMLNGGRDENVRPAGARAFAATLRPLYMNARAGPFTHLEYADVDHFPSEAAWADIWSTAVAFLAYTLGRSG